MNFEQRFIAEMDKYKFISEGMSSDLQRLDDWREGLTAALNAEPMSSPGLKSSGALAKQVGEVRKQIKDSMRSWSKAWASREPMKALSDSFGDKAIFLVFGKVNAGKSSFCNFLVERFSDKKRSFQYFYIHNGKIIESSEPFKEGITETTARIQGVRLGENLILLDTPGLLSVTPENHALTQQFLDSADAVLWLTSSSSPGQVQELDELQKELKSGKPLLPVITKSDFTEEDEVDGKIVRTLLNKSREENRAPQEQDVRKRATEKLVQTNLDPSQLRAPVSVSAHAARMYAQNPDAMSQAGFESLFEHLLRLSEDALVYKRKKAGSIVVSFLDSKVIGVLHQNVFPQLKELQKLSAEAVVQLDSKESQMASSAILEVTSELPGIMEVHKDSQDVKAVYRDVHKCISDAVSGVMKAGLGDYAVKMDKAISKMQPATGIGFDDVEIEVEVRTGAAAKTTASVASGALGAYGGTKAGAAAGALLGPVGAGIGAVVGGVVGGLIGGFLGSEGGEIFEETEIQRRKVGVSYERILSAIDADVRKLVPHMVNDAHLQCKEVIQAIEQEVIRLEDIIRGYQSQLDTIKQEIANDAV